MAISYKNNSLFMEQVDLAQVADEVHTPCYVYSSEVLINNYQEFAQGLKGHKSLVCFAVKACSNLSILKLLSEQGCGFDVVSQGELLRVIKAGGDPKKVVFSGVAKKEQDIILALEHEINCINVESVPELERINLVAKKIGKVAPVSLRINPDVDAKTHPYISTGLTENKFGIESKDALSVYQQAAAMQNIKIKGIDFHIGSQITDLSSFLEAIDLILVIYQQLLSVGIKLDHIDIGGGLGVNYLNNDAKTISEFLQLILPKFANLDVTLIFEPGRAICANAGVLLTQVQYLKSNSCKNFAIVDAGMNDMIRPALYESEMDIKEVKQHTELTACDYDVVGPICETSDFLGKNRSLKIKQGDYLAQLGAGAYGATMGSNYNTMPKCAEVLVSADSYKVIRKRQDYEQIWQDEIDLV